MTGDAVLSECGRYRYRLTRYTAERPRGKWLVVVGLNPSTADATVDDPTIRRCAAFARREAADLVMLNLFGLRATDPTTLRDRLVERIGPQTDRYLLEEGAARADRVVVAAWGSWGAEFVGRARFVADLLTGGTGVGLSCFGVTKDGHPRHPLYLPASTPLVPWSPPWSR